uniref:Molybdopterin synthase sulfur carrier subunit n=1 Tax=Phytophthora fragariae TaxID=53985 RepID=A0A6A3EY87_9STRA|nr:hypothetical protein PF009_g11751 [Phytophthora fragariae]
MTMEIKVLYFASAREEVGLREEKLTLPRSSATLRELRRVLMDKHPQAAATIESITLARNLEYSDDDVALADGDEVALIPPISGGVPRESPTIAISSGSLRNFPATNSASWTPPVQRPKHRT